MIGALLSRSSPLLSHDDYGDSDHDYSANGDEINGDSGDDYNDFANDNDEQIKTFPLRTGFLSSIGRAHTW